MPKYRNLRKKSTRQSMKGYSHTLTCTHMHTCHTCTATRRLLDCLLLRHVISCHSEFPSTAMTSGRRCTLLSLRTPSRESIDNLKGVTLEASLTFQPTSSSLWLLGSADRELDSMRSAVPYTLLCDVRPLKR